jgi:DNA-directed RNA polymerase specialized sigma subunit
VNELHDLERAVSQREATLAAATQKVDEAMMAAYRAQRDDGTPQFTLTEIGRVLGVSRQRVYQLVREASARGR